MKLKINSILSAMIMGCTSVLGTQASAATVEGIVKDKFARPLVGAVIKYDNVIYTTDQYGKFSVEVGDKNSTLTLSFPGFASKNVEVGNKTTIEVELEPNAARTEQLVELGYTSQTRNAVSGAVSTVTGKELSRYPTVNLFQTLPGNLTGLNYYESDNNLMNPSIGLASRGISTLSGRNLLMVVDGVITPSSDCKYITAQEIESISLLKDASTTAIYGIQGANGVLVITTKRGKAGRASVNVTYDASLQQMTNRPISYDSWEYATMRNQAAYNDNNSAGRYSQYSQRDVEGFRSGSDYYPNNNWVDKYLTKLTSLHRIGVDVTGGSRKIRYYSQIGYSHQGSQFNVDNNQSKYDSEPSMQIFKARTNMDMDFNKYLSGFANLSAKIASNRMSIAPNDNGAENSSIIYARLLNLPSTLYGPTTQAGGEGEVVTTEKESNPIYGILNRSGYTINTSTTFQAQAGLKLDMGFWVKGLSVSGSMAFQGLASQIQKNSTTYQRQIRDLSGGYETLKFSNFGTDINSAMVNSNSGNFSYNLSYYGNIDYARTWGAHSVTAKGYTYFNKQVLASSTKGVEVMPYIRHTLGAEAQYGFRDTYFLKLDLAYSGSDQFARKNRYTAMPSVSAAWVLSNEDFMKSLDVITYLKVRASYGITANDNFPGGGRFLYMDYFSSYGDEKLIGNPNLYAERLRNQNYGIDITLFNALSIHFDYFDVRNNKMLISTNNYYPEYMGASNTTIVNKGRMKNHGFELNIDYTKELNRDWSYSVGAGLSHTKNKVLYTAELQNPDYYQTYRTDGFAAGAIFGYRVDYSNGNGFINTQEELERYTPMYVNGGLGTPRMGDLIYRDLNHDGKISSADADHLGSTIPEYFYSFNASLRYKSFELFVQFDGAGKSHQMLILAPNSMDGIFTDVHRNAWTAERYAAGAPISYPALYIGNSTSNASSDYFLNNTSYVTLRNVTLSYTLPQHLSRKIGCGNIKFSFTGQNLFTLDGMKSDYMDPRVSSTTKFQPYRIFNLGVNVTF